MLWRRCGNVMVTSRQRRKATLLQRWRITSPQLSFFIVPQHCENANRNGVATFSQCLCVSQDPYFLPPHFDSPYSHPIPRIPHIPHIHNLILCIPILIPRIPPILRIPPISLIPFLDFPFQLLQIALLIYCCFPLLKINIII